MRIGYVSREVAGFRGGGIGTYVVEAGRAMRARGHEVWLLTIAPESEAEARALREHPDFDRVLFAGDGVPEADRPTYRICTAPVSHSHLVHETLRRARIGFDYLEFADYEAEGYVAVREQRLFQTYGAEAAVSVVLHSPSLECFTYNQQAHLMHGQRREIIALEHDMIASAPHLWCPSTRLGDMVAGRLGLQRDRIGTIRLPLTLGPPPPPPPPRDALEQVRFLFFGRLEPRKGLAELLAAFARMPDLSLDVVGSDGHASPWQTSYREYLEPVRPPNVRIHEALPREALLRRLADADVCVFAPTWDNWPMACVEAMAQARVVLGGRGSGMAEMIEHGRSGFLFDGSNPADLVRLVRGDLAAALARLPQIGAAAAERIRALSEPARYAEAIEALIERHRDAVRGRAARSAPQPSTVSVVMPYYNETPGVIGAAVDSVLAQTHEDLELLIVADGAPRPDAADTLRELAGRDPRIQVHEKAQGGLARARNHALDRARGDVVLCLDADNIAHPDYAATAARLFAEIPDAAALSVQAEEFREPAGASNGGTGVINALPYEPALALLGNQFGDAGAAFRRSTMERYGLRYDPRVDLYCDWALWLDLARHGLRVEVVPRVLYRYRLRPDSMMRTDAHRRHTALVGLLIEHHLDAGPDEKARLITQLHAWGLGALCYAFAPEHVAQSPHLELASALFGLPQATAPEAPLRHRAADALARAVGRIPVLAPLLGRAVESSLRWHGRVKDRRARR